MRAAALLLSLLAGCYLPQEKVVLRIELPERLASEAKQLEVLPHIAELRREGERGVVAVELKREAGKVLLVLPGACPATIDLRNLPARGATPIGLRPLFEVGPSERVVGLGQPEDEDPMVLTPPRDQLGHVCHGSHSAVHVRPHNSVVLVRATQPG